MWCESINELDPYKAVIDDRTTMSDWQRGMLKGLLYEAESKWLRTCIERDDEDCDDLIKPYGTHAFFIVDYLLAHGVSVVPSKVMEAEK